MKPILHDIQWTDENISSFWDYYANNKIETYFTYEHGGRILKYVSRHVNLKDMKMLDFGSGPGCLFRHIQHLGLPVKYAALDFSEDSVKYINDNFTGTDNFLYATHTFTYPSPIQDKFDAIICCEVIEHLNDEKLESVIAEMHRLLKPGGVLAFTTPNKENLNESKIFCPECGCRFHKWQHQRSWNPQNIRQYMEQRGIDTIHVGETNFTIWKGKLKNLAKKVLGSKVPKQHLVYIGKKK